MSPLYNPASSSGSTTFADNVFAVQDDGDATKQFKVQASGITTGTSRTMTVPNTDFTPDLPAFTVAAFMTTAEVNPATGTLVTTDGYTLLNGDRVAVSGGTTARNGIWVAASGAWSRATDCANAADLPHGRLLYVQNNQTNRGNQWMVVNNTGAAAPGSSGNFLGALPMSHGSGGVTSSTGIRTAIGMSAKGDLLTSNGTAIDSGISGSILQTYKLPVGTNGQALVADSTQTGGIKWADPGGYPLLAATRPGAGQGNTNGATSYFGYTGADTTLTNESAHRIYITKSGTITKAYGQVTSNTVSGGTTESVVVSFRLNNTTDTTITSSLNLSALTSTAPVTFNNTGLSIAVAAGDYFVVKVVNPTWVTPPSGNTGYSVGFYVQ